MDTLSSKVKENNSNMLNNDLADVAQIRNELLENSTPCGLVVAYQSIGSDCQSTTGIFYFKSEQVEKIAKDLDYEYEGSLFGMDATMLWASLRNATDLIPTPVPTILANFDYIVEASIDAGHGYVKCLACYKDYKVTQLKKTPVSFPSSARSGWLYTDFVCPAKHSLFKLKVMHMFRTRSSD